MAQSRANFKPKVIYAQLFSHSPNKSLKLIFYNFYMIIMCDSYQITNENVIKTVK